MVVGRICATCEYFLDGIARDNGLNDNVNFKLDINKPITHIVCANDIIIVNIWMNEWKDEWIDEWID